MITEVHGDVERKISTKFGRWHLLRASAKHHSGASGREECAAVLAVGTAAAASQVICYFCDSLDLPFNSSKISYRL
jgi:hypothetical protein